MAQFLDLTGLSRFKNKNDGIYAQKDGYYQNLGAGVADQLRSSVGIEDQTPYNFRTSGGSVDIGDREKLNAVVGVSVPWNQLVPTANRDFTSESSDTRALFFVLRKSSSPYTTLYQKQNVAVGILSSVVASSFDGYAEMTHSGTQRNIRITPVDGFQLTNGHKYLFSLNFTAVDTSTVGGVVAKDISVYDLTLALGSSIADYIYALEHSNAGAGVAYFRKLFPKPFYQYNSGALLSARTNLHKMVGFNAYNHTTGTAKLVGGNQYQITGAYTALSLDGTTITPDANGKFTPSANGTLTVTGGNNTTTCVHLVWDGERNGEYLPYDAHEYALDDITLRGMLRLDANNNLYANGDRYLPDGTVERKYVEYTFSGSENWDFNENSGFFQANLTTPNGVTAGTHLTSNGILVNVVNGHYARAYLSANPSLSASSNMNTVFANGTKMVYELATPTTESASPYQQTQIVDDFGTEEFVDAAVEANERDVAIPVGHETFYQNNLKAKLEMAPNSPDGDGVYVVQQTNGENEYIPLVIPVELPTFPADDGTYVLKITVSGETVTKAWVEEV